MSLLVFDSSPLISLGDNCLLCVVKELKRLGHRLVITSGVQKEIFSTPVHTKRFKLKALMLESLVRNNVLEVVSDPKIIKAGEEIEDLANSLVKYKRRNVRIIQRGEAESMAAYLLLNADALVVDERTTRLLIEAPLKIAEFIKSRTGQHLKTDKQVMEKVEEKLGLIRVIRSAELVAYAYEKGFLSCACSQPNAFEASLYALKFSGCSITKEEIEEYARMMRMLR